MILYIVYCIMFEFFEHVEAFWFGFEAFWFELKLILVLRLFGLRPYVCFWKYSGSAIVLNEDGSIGVVQQHGRDGRKSEEKEK